MSASVPLELGSLRTRSCPEEAIYMSDDCDISMLDRKKMKYNMEQLLVPVSELKDRMEFCRNIYGKWNY